MSGNEMSGGLDMSLALGMRPRPCSGSPWKISPNRPVRRPSYRGKELKGIKCITWHHHAPTTESLLLALPLELRLIVYDYLIVPGDVCIRYLQNATSNDRWIHDLLAWQKERVKVESQLFLVCKQIHEESMQHYLASNKFVLMGCDTELPYFSWGMYPPRDSHIRRLSIAFDGRACDMQRNVNTLGATRHLWQERHPEGTPDDWRSHVHEELQWELLHLRWMPMVCQIHQLVLRTLEVNVQNCWCPCKCINQTGWAMGWLCQWEGQPPDVLVVLGTRGTHEREEIELIVKATRQEGRPELRFEKCLDNPPTMDLGSIALLR